MACFSFFLLFLFIAILLGLIAYLLYYKYLLQQQLSNSKLQIQQLNNKISDLNNLLDSLPLGMTVFKPDGTVLCRNQQAKAMASNAPDSDYEVCAIDTGLPYPMEKTPFQQAVNGQASFIEDAEIKICNRIIPVAMWGCPVYNKNRQLIFVITLFQDIKKRIENNKLYEQRLRQLMGEKERFRTIAETMPIPLFILSLADGLILYANPQAAASFGLSLQKLLGKQMADLYLDLADRQRFLGKLLREKEVRGYEVQYVRADGTPFWALAYSRIMLYYHEQVILTSMLDITERKQIEQQRLAFTQELYTLNQAYQRFVPSEFLNLLDRGSVVDIQLGDHVEREMTILFSDIRDFTRLSEQMTPEETFNFINHYLQRMEPIIAKNRGFVDKYIGDAIMALFPHSADDALQSGLQMLAALEEFNQQSEYVAIKIGIGINTGKLMLGTIGGQQRMDGTVIADAVNLASRVESLTKQYATDLLITQHTYARLQGNYQLIQLDAVKVKGKSELVTIYAAFNPNMN
jgi:adenylate cyclase